MSTCSTCRHFDANPHEDNELVIAVEMTDWLAADVEGNHYDTKSFGGFCNLAVRRNSYDQWLDQAPIPIAAVHLDAPMRLHTDGCCASMAVRSDFGCNAWEAR